MQQYKADEKNKGKESTLLVATPTRYVMMMIETGIFPHLSDTSIVLENPSSIHVCTRRVGSTENVSKKKNQVTISCNLTPYRVITDQH